MTSLFARIHNTWFMLRDRESGQTLVEYALIVSLIAVVCIGGLMFLGGRVNQLFSKAGSNLP